MATFYNQASFSFGGTVTNSNTVTGEIVASLTMTKTAASANYGTADGITYVVSIVNASDVEYADLTLTDNLGAYTVPGGTTEVVPLTYVDGSVLYYQNGVLQPAPTVEAGPPLEISGITVPANGNAIIVYEARANEYAPLSAGSSIYNEASISTCGLTASAAVGTRDEAILSITKSVCPEVVSCSGEVTYTILLQNTGNTPVVATDDLIVTDTFNPILEDLTVTLDGTELAEGVGYTYDEATGAFATLPGAITVPAATYERDSETGTVTTTPGFAVLTITGNV
ncbi:MAG: hypothetical protein IJY65_04810 [Clostridia bacterium]|nr:hypothetical protein [Clostridia bacterium]